MSKRANRQYTVDNADNTVNVKLSLAAFIGKEKPGRYVSYCPALDLCSMGHSRKEAEKNIIEATELFIEACLEDGVLGKVLEDCGFHSIHHATHRSRQAKKLRTESELLEGDTWEIRVQAELPVMAYA